MDLTTDMTITVTTVVTSAPAVPGTEGPVLLHGYYRRDGSPAPSGAICSECMKDPDAIDRVYAAALSYDNIDRHAQLELLPDLYQGTYWSCCACDMYPEDREEEK